MIGQILVILLVIAMVWFIYRKKSTPNTKKSQPKKESQNKEESSFDRTMVECVKCGVYIATDEAILSSGKYYCSDECLRS